ncbi:MAG: ABC transporter permease [Myxococcales bacterium]|nr:ABC transporter permease [Myxococcales bacterium]
MKLSFELLVAARYLRADRPPGALDHLRWATLGLIVLTASVFAGSELVEHLLKDHLSETLWNLRSPLRGAKYLTVLVTVLVGFFIELIRRLTIFTTISTFGLFLGTGALVTVLSVMSGFEQDLKTKILGTHAHMVVTTPDRSFTDYRESLAKVEKIPGVQAASPYLSSEVMIASQSNLAGVIIKGIDPQTVGKVTELVKNTEAGSLDHLLHPDQMVRPASTRTLSPASAVPDGGAASPDGGAASPDGGAASPDGGTASPDGGAAGSGSPTFDPVAQKPKIQAPRKVLPGLAIGRELARNLRVFVGEDVSLVSPMGDVGPTGPIPKSKPHRIAAVFFSGMYEYDSKYAYMNLPAAQKFLGLDDEVTGLELKLANPEATEVVSAQLRAALGPGFLVQDWKELNRSLFAALKLEKIAMFIALCFIILVAAFSIVSNGIMLVMEKGKEVAILKSMGASDRAVLRVFVLLGAYMGLVGTTAGVLTGVATCWVFDRFGLPLDTDVYYITKLPVKVSPGELSSVLLASLVLTLLATLYPAWQAARLRPVDALR